MLQSIKDVLREYMVDGDVILYRDTDHRKKGMTEHLVKELGVKDGVPVVTYSDGAFALYLARALPNNVVHACFNILSPDYGELMQKQPNLVLHSGMRMLGNTVADYPHFLGLHPDYFEINQLTNSSIVDYYSNYFSRIVSEVGDLNVDAFCDCSHSANTLAGFIKSGLVDWDFIVGSIDLKCLVSSEPDILNFILFADYRDSLIVECATRFDTYALGELIERRHPEFGNVYESTRSISAAMSYLKRNPGKTVLVYVGDSFEKEGSKFNKSSVSYSWSRGLYLSTKILDAALNEFSIDSESWDSYLKFYLPLVADSDRKYIFSNLLALFFRYLFDLNKDVNVDSAASIVNEALSLLNSSSCSASESTILLLEAMFACAEGTLTVDEYVDNLLLAVKKDFFFGQDFILEYEALRSIQSLRPSLLRTADFLSLLDSVEAGRNALSNRLVSSGLR